MPKPRLPRIKRKVQPGEVIHVKVKQGQPVVEYPNGNSAAQHHVPQNGYVKWVSRLEFYIIFSSDHSPNTIHSIYWGDKDTPIEMKADNDAADYEYVVVVYRRGNALTLDPQIIIT